MGLADGPTEVHKVTVARQVLRDYGPSVRPVADERMPQAGGGGTREARRVPRARSREPDRPTSTGSFDLDSTARPRPDRASPSSTASSPGGPRTRSTRSAAATSTARLRITAVRTRVPRRPASSARWHIIEALTGTDVPHTDAIAVVRRPLRSATFYVIGFVDGWSPWTCRTHGRRRSTPTSTARAGPRLPVVEGITLLPRSTGGQGPPGPRATGQLPPAPGRSAGPLPRADQRTTTCRASRAAAWLRVRTRRSTTCRGLMHGDYQFANVMYCRAAPPALTPSSTGRWARSAIPSSTWRGWCRAGPRTRVRRRRSRATSTWSAIAVARTRCSISAEVSGRQVDDIDYYLVLAKWKLAVVLEQGFQRAGDDEKLLASVRSRSTSCRARQPGRGPPTTP